MRQEREAAYLPVLWVFLKGCLGEVEENKSGERGSQAVEAACAKAPRQACSTCLRNCVGVSPKSSFSNFPAALWGDPPLLASLRPII